MCTEPSPKTPRAPNISDAPCFDWIACPIAQRADHFVDLVRFIATELPRGEFRLKNHLFRTSQAIFKNLGLAASEPDPQRHNELIINAVRAIADGSLWLWHCIKHGFGPDGLAQHAWSLLKKIRVLISELDVPGLRAHRRRSAPQPESRAVPAPAPTLVSEVDAVPTDVEIAPRRPTPDQLPPTHSSGKEALSADGEHAHSVEEPRSSVGSRRPPRGSSPASAFDGGP